MRPAPLWLLALACSLALAPAAAQTAAPAAWSAADAVSRADRLLADFSPASADVLEDKAFLSALRAADPEKAAQLARQKLFLRDAAWLVEQYRDSGYLRAALRARESEPFDPLWRLAGLGPEPSKLLDWVGAHYGAAVRKRFAAALYEYADCEDAVRALLDKTGVKPDYWETKTFRERDRLLESLGVAQESAVMAAPLPWTEEQRRDFERRVQDVFSLLPRDKQLEVGNRMASDRLLRTGLADIKKRRLGPGGEALLAKANDQSLSPTQRLAALAQAYDGSPDKGELDPEQLKAMRVDRERAGPPMFTADQRRLLAQMAPSAYLRTIAQADVAGLNDYFARHRLRLEVVDVGATAVAQYDPAGHRLLIGSHDVEAWLQAKGRTPRDLLTDTALFDRFILETSPVFVHEAVHQTQFEGFHLDSDALHNQTFEIHAMFMQAMYTRELSKKSKAFAAFVEQEQGSSGLAVMAAGLQDAMRRGPRYFRSYIASSWYTQYPSQAQPALLQIDVMETIAKQVEADARARAGPFPPHRPANWAASAKTYGDYRVATARADAAGMRAAAAKLSPDDALAVADGLRGDEAMILRTYQDMAKWWDGVENQIDDYWVREYGSAGGAAK